MNPGVTRLVIVIALVVSGVVVLAQGFGDETVAAPPPTSPDPTPTETQSPPPPPPDEGEIVGEKDGVLVQVLNGTFTPGLAADFQATLEDEGYVPSGDPTDAPNKPIVDTVVYFRPDQDRDQNEADAGLLAKDYLNDAPVERLPRELQDDSVTNPAADVIVVLGEDFE